MAHREQWLGTDERDLRIIILEKSHAFNNVPESLVNPHYIPSQQGALLEGELVAGMEANPDLILLVQNNAPVDQVAAHLQGINQELADIPQHPVNSQRIVPQPVDIHSPNNGFYSNFGENLKNLFSASCEWVTATVTNLFSRFEFNNHHNQHNVHIPNIEQGEDHGLSWANSISNFGRLFDAISSFSAYLWPEPVSSQGGGVDPGVVGGELHESE